MIKFTIEEFHRQKLLSSVQLSQVDRATIGRSIDCTYNLGVQFPDVVKASISRVQCSLVRQGDTFLIDGTEEKPSQTGVYYKGKLIDSPMAVSIGDIFTVFQAGEYSVSLICQSGEPETASHAIIRRIDVHSEKSDKTAQEVHEIHEEMRDRFAHSDARLLRLETQVGEIGKTIVEVVNTNTEQNRSLKRHSNWIFGVLAALVVLVFLSMADTTKRKDFAEEIFPLLIKAGLAIGAGVVGSKTLNQRE